MGGRQSSPLQEGNPRAIGAEYGRLDRSRIRIGKKTALLETVRIFRGRGAGVVRNRVEETVSSDPSAFMRTPLTDMSSGALHPTLFALFHIHAS